MSADIFVVVYDNLGWKNWTTLYNCRFSAASLALRVIFSVSLWNIFGSFTEPFCSVQLLSFMTLFTYVIYARRTLLIFSDMSWVLTWLMADVLLRILQKWSNDLYVVIYILSACMLYRALFIYDFHTANVYLLITMLLYQKRMIIYHN